MCEIKPQRNSGHVVVEIFNLLSEIIDRLNMAILIGHFKRNPIRAELLIEIIGFVR